MNLTQTAKTLLLAFSAAATLLLSLSVDAQIGANVQPVKRVVEAVDVNDRVPLPSSSKGGSARSWVKSASDLGELPGGTAASHMMLLLKRSGAQQQALTEYLSDLQNPASANYHHWLTPGQFANSFGVNAEDVQAVTGWLESQGFKIDKVATARNLVEFSGTASQLEQTFQAKIHRFSVAGKTQATSVNNIQVPRALAPVIGGLVNLESGHAHSLVQLGATAKYDRSARRIRPDLTLFGSSGPQLYVDPADAAVIYNTPNAALNPNYTGSTLDGTGVTVGIVGVSNVDLTGVSNYRQAFLGETSNNVN
ncbi:MAG TPA: protease pro-enzyme activation domain-containing protein, partial [Acidobacteriaceae bacterium]